MNIWCWPGEFVLFREEDIEILMRLGLTLLQAKAYLTLSVLETATMQTISRNSSIARQDVYRIMPLLQKLGLAEKIITSPATYKSIPVKDGISLLLQKKKEERANLQNQANFLLSNLRETENDENPEDKTQFAMIYDRSLLFKKFEKGNKTSMESIDCSGTWPDIKEALLAVLKDHLKQATTRGVRVRIVTENPGNDKSTNLILQNLSESPLFEMRCVPPPIPVKIVIYDKKEANTSISTKAESDMPSLWSNNPNFVKILSNQFEEMWSKGEKLPKSKTSKKS
jgi:sugar-specific transcriptional regulator TrmB